MKKNIILLLLLLLFLFVLFFYILNATTLVKKEFLNKRIHIIYYSFLLEERWKYIVLPQMQGLIDCDLASNADISIVLSGNKNTIEEAETQIRRLLSPHCDNLQFDYEYENLYEYPGILKLYKTAVSDPDKIYLYFHSKGMVFSDQTNQRTTLEKNVYNVVILNWKNAINIFDNNPNINKVCCGCSEKGFCWYNFFYIRGEYLQKCNKPIISDNRYYYETYIADEYPNASYSDCYNLLEDNKKAFFSQDDLAFLG